MNNGLVDKIPEYLSRDQLDLLHSTSVDFTHPEPYRERVATTPFTPMERFFYSNGGSWSLSKVPGSSSKHMQRHRDAAEQTVCDALLKG